VSTTGDLVAVLEDRLCDRCYVLAHPGRWAATRTQLPSRVAWDVGAEGAKLAARWINRFVNAREGASRPVESGRTISDGLDSD
jgi:hypothetical protein